MLSYYDLPPEERPTTVSGILDGAIDYAVETGKRDRLFAFTIIGALVIILGTLALTVIAIFFDVSWAQTAIAFSPVSPIIAMAFMAIMMLISRAKRR